MQHAMVSDSSGHLEVDQCQQKLSEMTQALIQLLSKVHRLQDVYTAGHQHRVGLFCKAIAEEMGWAESDCGQMYYVGLLHDFGKIAIPHQVLHKVGTLEHEEKKLIKSHVEVTYDLLKDIPFEFPLAEIVVQHHERIDGSGYPKGLKGDQILPQANILIVADVVEAIAAKRSYREALGLDFALSELKKGQGKIYDQTVCDAVFRLFYEKDYALPTSEQ
ncbi:hypothetical protein CAP51_01820 [Acinetobacter populi]|uniref:HD-GYP domain-containing protein n=2 Tax=Acinetobacter populi TaxID=1582270 RepID=A0A1Z9Z1M7_9GAMM|nr:hypothetical protein CAP51_01820 [Acinetobacter populi]